MLSHRTLNRTLLQRQHLLVRARMPALEMTEHLLGLQAQEPLPPYLSLWSRVEGFDPAALSDALEARTAVRLLLMRGTIHLVTSADAVRLRPLVQATLDRVARVLPEQPRRGGRGRRRTGEGHRGGLRGGAEDAATAQR